MKDSELLERAANAAGYKWRWFGEDFCTERDERTGLHKPWNPLTDGSDALRLAVKLRIDVDQGEIGTEDGVPAAVAGYRIEFRENFYRWESVAEKSEPDPYAATCRAIVRAAAAMADERSAAPTPLTGATKPNVPDPAPSLEGVRNA